MALQVLDQATVAAIRAAMSSQTAQRDALVAAFAGANVTVQYKRIADDATVEVATHGPMVPDSSTPRGFTLGPLLASTVNISGQVVTHAVYRNNLAVDIYTRDAADLALVSPTTLTGRRINGADAVLDKQLVTALASLPVTGAALQWTGPSSGSVGAASSNFTATLIGGTADVLVTPGATPSGTWTPTSRTLTVGAPTGTFTLTPIAAAVHSATLANDAGLSAPAALSYTASAAAPTTATLSGSTSATEGVAQSYAVTLDTPADQTYTITWARSDSGTGSATSTITTGQTSASATSTWAAAGAGRTVDFTISPSLTRAGRPITVTVAAAPTITPGAIPDLTLTASVTGTHGWTVGHPFKQGDVPDGQAIAGLQMNVMTRWPDNSVKHALLSGTNAFTADVAGAVAIATGVAASGPDLTIADLKAALSQPVDFDAGAFGSASISGTDWDTPHTVVATGPVMSSWVHRNAFSSDAHLVAWVETRIYSTGAVEVFPWVENGYLTVAGPTNKSATYTFSLGGTTRFSQAIDIKHHTRVPLVNTNTGEGGPRSFAHYLGTDAGVVPAHDAAYVMATKLVPNMGAPAPSSGTLDALAHDYTPNTLAGDTEANGGTGGAGGVLSKPSAMYVTSGGDVRAWKGMMAHGLSSGSWSHHYRDENTNLPLAFSDYPNTSLAQPGAPTIPTGSGGSNASGPVLSHTVSYAYLPFLMTGRWWFLEELHFWVGHAFMQTGYTTRNYADGLYFGGSTPRGRAWSLNVLAQAAAVTPTSHPLSAEFVASWQANTAKHRARFVDGTEASGAWVHPQGFLGDYTGNSDSTSAYSPVFVRTGNGSQTSFETYGTRDITTYSVTVNSVAKTYPTDWTVSGTSIVFAVAPANDAEIRVTTNADQWWTGPWQHHYLSIVFGFASDIGIPQSSQSLLDHIAVRDHGYKHQVQTAGDGYAGRFNWRHFTRYIYPFGADKTNLPVETPYTSVQSYAVYLAELGLPAVSPAYGGTLLAAASTLAAGTADRAYAAPGITALAQAVEHGVSGAAEAYLRITGASNYASALSSYTQDTRPDWSVVPRVPSWVPAVGTVADVSLNTVDGAAGRTVNFWKAWSCVAWAPWWGTYGSVLISGGGHTDGLENDTYRYDVDSRTVSRIKDTATVYENSGYCADVTTGWLWTDVTATAVQTGEPYAPHHYASMIALPETAIPGAGATNGWLVTAARQGMGSGGSQASPQQHKLRMGVDQQWSFFGSSPTNVTSYGPACYDASRNRMWWLTGDSSPRSVFCWRVADTEVEGSVDMTGADFVAREKVMFWASAHDLLITVKAHTADLVIGDPATNTLHEPSLTGTGPAAGVGRWTWGWSDAWNSLFFYSGSGNVIWFLKPIGNPRSASWAWSSQTIATGTIRPAEGAAEAYMRMIHVAALGDVLLWCGTTEHAIQALHVTAP